MRHQHSGTKRGFLTRAGGIASVFALIAGVLVWGLPVGSNAAFAAARSVKACSSANLVIWLDTVGNGAAGSSYYSLNFTNLSPHACTLSGFPGVSGVSLRDRQVGSAAARDNTVAPSVITLTSAHSARGLESASLHNTATAILQITEVENFPSRTCRQISAAGLRVYAPGQTVAKIVAFPFSACAKSGPRYLHVEAIQKDVIFN